MALWLSLIAIIVSIVLGYMLKINTGIIAMAFAFLLGVLMLDMKVSAIISLFPIAIVFYLLSISLFFYYPTANGTMALLGEKLLYRLNGNAKLVPWAIVLVGAIVAFCGAGASTPAIIGPVAFAMAAQAGVHPMITCAALISSALIGADNPFNGYGGTISMGLIESAGYPSETALSMQFYMWGYSTIKCLVVILVAYIIFKGYKAERVVMQKPADYTPQQKKTITIVIVSLVLMVVPTMLNTFIPGVQILAQLSKLLQPQSVMIFGAVTCVILKLGDEKDCIRKLPMNSIVMISGVAMLVGVAEKAGMVDAVSNLLAQHVPTILVPAVMGLLAAFLSFFSSGMSVVCPLIYPLVPGLAASLGINPLAMFTVVNLCANTSNFSPFSTAGAMCIAGCPDEEQKNALFNPLLIAGCLFPFVPVILQLIGIFNINPF